jgi:hypothetical protein
LCGGFSANLGGSAFRREPPAADKWKLPLWKKIQPIGFDPALRAVAHPVRLLTLRFATRIAIPFIRLGVSNLAKPAKGFREARPLLLGDPGDT